MGHDRLSASVPEGEALRYTDDCRGGGSVGVTDERLLVADGDGTTSVELGSIDEVTVRDYDYFVGSMSVGLLAVGALAATDNPLVGVLFVAGGVASLIQVYRKRGKVMVDVANRAKPLVFYLDHHEAFLARLEDRLDDYEERLWEEADVEREPE